MDEDGVKIPNNLSDPDWGALGKIVYDRSYSRIKEDGEREEWAETDKRTVDGNCGYVEDRYIEPYESKKLFHMLYNFEGIPAGRHLWSTGIGGGSEFVSNCFAVGFDPHDFSRHFVYSFLRLMEGGGVGTSVNNRLVRNYPSIPNEVEAHIVCSDDHDDYGDLKPFLSGSYSSKWMGCFEVEDSREGWGAALGKLLDSYYNGGRDVVIDVSHVRPSGTPLKTFGGTASGPKALAQMLVNISGIMNDHKGRVPTSELVLDIDHEIAKAVIAGGTRRSARMASKYWKDPDIIDFVQLKLDGSSHWTANFSVEVDKDFWEAVRSDDEDAVVLLNQIVEGIYQNGEPGLINLTKCSEGEINEPFTTNPCLAGDTLIPTRLHGFSTIESLVDESFQVWDGENWVDAEAQFSGNKEAIRINLSTGNHITCTPDHILYSNGVKVKAGELQVGDFLDDLQAPKDMYGPAVEDEYRLAGFVFCNGSCHRDSNRWKYINFSDRDSEVIDLAKMLWGIEKYSDMKPHSWEIPEEVGDNLNTVLDDTSPVGVRNLPSALMSWPWDYQASFIAGLYSANGSLCGSRITLKSTSKSMIEDVQQFLSCVGIRSYITTNKSHDQESSNETYHIKESYDLNIATNEGKKEFLDLFPVIQSEYKERISDSIDWGSDYFRRYYPEIKSIEDEGEIPVYDYMMNRTHYASIHRLKVGNCGEIVGTISPSTNLEGLMACNLGNLNLDKLANDNAKMKEVARLMARVLIRATYADYPDPELEQVVQEERRIGVGFMGFHPFLLKNGCRYTEFPHNDEMKGVMKELKEEVREAAREYAFQLRIPEPVKVTTIPPTGSTSKLAGTTPGMQPMEHKYFLRRIRYTLIDEEKKKEVDRLDSLGFNVIRDIPEEPDTAIVEFPLKAPDLDEVDEDLVETVDDISIEQMMEVQATLQDVWADNSISVTISFDQDEVSKGRIKEALKAYVPRLKGVTLFPKVSNMDNAPIEPLTKEEFMEYPEHLRQEANAAGECVTGSCEFDPSKIKGE